MALRLYICSRVNCGQDRNQRKSIRFVKDGNQFSFDSLSFQCLQDTYIQVESMSSSQLEAQVWNTEEMLWIVLYITYVIIIYIYNIHYIINFINQLLNYFFLITYYQGSYCVHHGLGRLLVSSTEAPNEMIISRLQDTLNRDCFTHNQKGFVCIDSTACSF